MPSTKQKSPAEGEPSVIDLKNDKGSGAIEEATSTVRRGNCPGLRASNQKKHPGLVDVSSDKERQSAQPTKKPRRSGEEVAAEKQAKADQAKKEAADNLLKKRNVAQNAARPPPGPIQVKAARPVAEVIAAAQDDIARIEQTVKASMLLHDGGAAKEPPVGQGQNRVPQPSAAAVGDDSDNRNCKDDEDYCPDADGKSEVSAKSDEDESDSNNQLALLVKSPVRPKPKAKKNSHVIARDEIRAERAVKDQPVVQKRGALKEEARSSTTPSNRLPPAQLAKVSVSSQWKNAGASAVTKTSRNIRGPADPRPVSSPEPDFGARYGGINDATEERENKPPENTLAVSRPGKQKVIAAIVRGAPQAKLQGHQTSKSSKTDGPSNSELPPGVLHTWKDIVMPTWHEFAGTVTNPWDTSSDILLQELNSLWNMTFPSMKKKLTTESVEYKLAKQRWYEWHAHIATTVRTHVDNHMKSLNLSIEDTAAHARFLLDADTVPFIWKQASQDMKPQSYSGLFWSELVLRGLADHMSAIAPVPTAFQVNNYPCAALALWAAAVERALKFWVDGDAETTFKATKADVRSFSESNHGLTTAKFMKSIKGLSDRAWTKILSEADAFVDDTLAPKVISSDDFDGVLTGRSCLFEADTDSESEMSTVY